jgi:hypothetical protein
MGTIKFNCLPATEANASDEATLLTACNPTLLHRIATGALGGTLIGGGLVEANETYI